MRLKPNWNRLCSVAQAVVQKLLAKPPGAGELKGLAQGFAGGQSDSLRVEPAWPHLGSDSRTGLGSQAARCHRRESSEGKIMAATVAGRGFFLPVCIGLP